MGQCHGQRTHLLIGRHIHFPQWHYGLISSRNEHVCLYHPIARGLHGIAEEKVLSISPLNRSSTIVYQCRLQHHVHWLHVQILVQCQNDDRCLGSKTTVDIREPLDKQQHFSHHSGNDGWWPLLLPLSRLSWVSLYRLHHVISHWVSKNSLNLIWASCLEIIFTHSFNEVMSCQVVYVCSQWEAWCPQGANQIDIDLRRCYGCLYLETNGACCGSGHASSPIWTGGKKISVGLVEFIQGMMWRIFNAGTCFEAAGYLPMAS